MGRSNLAVKNEQTSYENISDLEHTDSKVVDISIKKNKYKIKEAKLLYRIIKRAIDILGSIMGITLLIPITIIVFIANLLVKDDNGPVFYTQIRIGKNGKEFKLYKYRSMVVNADERLKKYLANNPDAKKEWRKYKKLKNDPRITKLGNFLRKTSLDEFPQFINILKGEMSLVGPRPYLPREKEDMGVEFEIITSAKPGLTGYWQVNGRSHVDFDERKNLDIYYLQNRSLVLDMKILIKTFFKIFKKEGAV